MLCHQQLHLVQHLSQTSYFLQEGGLSDNHWFPGGSILPVNDKVVLVKEHGIEKSEFSPSFV